MNDVFALICSGNQLNEKHLTKSNENRCVATVPELQLDTQYLHFDTNKSHDEKRWPEVPHTTCSSADIEAFKCFNARARNSFHNAHGTLRRRKWTNLSHQKKGKVLSSVTHVNCGFWIVWNFLRNLFAPSEIKFIGAFWSIAWPPSVVYLAPIVAQCSMFALRRQKNKTIRSGLRKHRKLLWFVSSRKCNVTRLDQLTRLKYCHIEFQECPHQKNKFAVCSWGKKGGW